jgi:hypothetical protein
MEQQWDDLYRKIEGLGEKSSQCHFVPPQNHMHYPGSKCRGKRLIISKYIMIRPLEKMLETYKI